MPKRLAVLMLATLALPVAAWAGDAYNVAAPGDWPRYARDLEGTRYSPLDQINAQNVEQLDQAWSFRLRPDGGGSLLGGTVPIAIDGILYMPLGNAVVALDGVSGAEIWRHKVDKGLVRRSVSFWPGEGAIGPRLFYSTGDRLVALKLATGEIDTSYGDNGSSPIEGTPYSYPPSIYGNVMIVGANTAEDSFGLSGDSRAYDARTGKKLWQFHTVPHAGEVGNETWLDGRWQDRSGNNMWIWYTTADPATDTIYMTIGGPSPNYYGGERPGDNLFGNSIVAVDANTGAYKWHFQTIHHDLWDWDLPAPPVLIDVVKDGKTIPALAETGKPGFMYILDRRTGEPIHGVVEQPVAAADVPGEWYSPTQPIPVKPAQLNRGYWDPSDVVSEADTTAEHVAACRALLDSYGGTFFNAGSFTPFFLKKDVDGKPFSSINMPHNGGSVWGGSAADPTKGVVFVNTSEGGSIGWIEARDAQGDYGRGTQTSTQPYDRGSLIGPGAYSGFTASYTNAAGEKLNLPCFKPPWGRLLAVDANSGDILWASRLGITEGLPEGKQDTGANNGSGGPTVTAGGLVFIGATGDRYFRAFDASNGNILWEQQLDYAPLTIPMTYLGKDGRQYVAVMASGSNLAPASRTPQGRPANMESLVTFALPEEPRVVRTPEGAEMQVGGELAYKPGELTQEQLMGSTRDLFRQDSMNVFRRFPREMTADMVRFYTEALALRSLNPIQLTSTQQMILTGVGSGQIKLSAGQQGDRKYDLSGGWAGGTGIRFLLLSYPDPEVVKKRFSDAGFAAPEFVLRGDGYRQALVKDPAGFDIVILTRPGLKDHSDDGVGIGIGVSDLAKSRAFYRDFVGLDELEPVPAPVLGTTLYPYRHKETRIMLYQARGTAVDNGSAGIQYVVSDSPMADAKAKARGIAVETPLNKLAGFDLITVWLNDPDGVTNYFAQVGRNSRTAREQAGQ